MGTGHCRQTRSLDNILCSKVLWFNTSLATTGFHLSLWHFPLGLAISIPKGRAVKEVC